jgi:chaperonin GroEL (HSP60 family)
MVLGGGCFEVQLARMLEAKAETHEGIERAVYLAFADAVKAVPLALAENAGANAMRYELNSQCK